MWMNDRQIADKSSPWFTRAHQLQRVTIYKFILIRHLIKFKLNNKQLFDYKLIDCLNGTVYIWSLPASKHLHSWLTSLWRHKQLYDEQSLFKCRLKNWRNLIMNKSAWTARIPPQRCKVVIHAHTYGRTYLRNCAALYPRLACWRERRG